jgi:glycerol-3-phosphate cytidylyltransferase
MAAGSATRKQRRVITMGTYDLFHIGHLKLLERASALGDYLVVGISTDKLNEAKKKRAPVYPQDDRRKIVSALRCVNETFFEESLEQKRDYIKQFQADIFEIGDDWKGRFDELNDLCKVIYLPRTPSVSSTQTIELIQRR